MGPAGLTFTETSHGSLGTGDGGRGGGMKEGGRRWGLGRVETCTAPTFVDPVTQHGSTFSMIMAAELTEKN